MWILSIMCLLAHASRSRRGKNLESRESPTKDLKKVERSRLESKGKERKGHHANGVCTSQGAVKRRRRAKRKELGEYAKRWPCGKSTTDKPGSADPNTPLVNLEPSAWREQIYPNQKKRTKTYNKHIVITVTIFLAILLLPLSFPLLPTTGTTRNAARGADEKMDEQK